MAKIKSLTLKVGAAGQDLKVSAGDTLRFELSSSAGTGYAWHVLDVDPVFLALVDRTVAAAPTANTAGASAARPVVGSSGPVTTYVYYVKKSLDLGGYSVTTPVVFVNLPPGRQTTQTAKLIQFNLAAK
ncbi:hypothetical protein EHF33_07000 [Deinococcus psychrotolerans]|uniref:Proteinase inhibitor I42 chagasin domain-containing protein n=1 Tax=Deinococcus psychrotolerans TaxID=2489213 RepID=A0A3G8YIZ6_9DEIO|nr:protease inhibitor I42 family protein [Deinococcus psychrotolerans]AZI42524.1 hypothetical protein EHF33_07000 [Deinococcus psychrotolerans]